MKQLWVQVETSVHGDMLHVFQAAYDLHVFGAGDNCVARLIQCLQT